MANSLKSLQPTDQPTDVQRTTLSADALARYVCNTLPEALASTDSAQSPDARPFDVVIVGGGTFGAVLAEHLFHRDTTHSHRILVLEGGPFLIPEHVQNLPMIGLGNAGPTTVEELRAMPEDAFRRWANVVWGLSWRANARFPGLAYCLGGRSLYWGGWSPRPLPGEMPATRWPAETVEELNERYFREASLQIGVAQTNDFIFGALHEVLRKRLHAAIGSGELDSDEVVPLDEIDLHLDDVEAGEEELAKLEAPLGVQGRPPRAGFFPFNKFSAMPLIAKAARAAQGDSGNVDTEKRLMVVPNCHVQRLVTAGDGGGRLRVAEVLTDQGAVRVPIDGTVVVALGTIESTRLALLSLGGLPPDAYRRIGTNLMAHLRSNVHLRIPREALGGDLPRELAVSALFLKGRHRFDDGGEGHYHIQITASGTGPLGGDSEVELWRKVPDIDGFEPFLDADDTHVIITLRGIGEMLPDNPESHVTLDLDPGQVDFGERRAFVSIAHPQSERAEESPQSRRDREVWDAMDALIDQLAHAFADGQPFEVKQGGAWVRVEAGGKLPTGGRRDGMGTTHHEGGTLWMGSDPARSVTDPNGRFRGTTNLYAVGPAVQPSLGSPNPMLVGVALARRLGDHLTAAPRPAVEEGFSSLFDGTATSFRRWAHAGGGSFRLRDGAIVAAPDAGGELGLLWYPTERFGDHTLRLQFRLESLADNSGVFVQFRDPRRPVPDRERPGVFHAYRNTAWVAVDTGFEIQIDELARPGGDDRHRTGAFYDLPIGDGDGEQRYTRPAAPEAGQWIDVEVTVSGQEYTASVGGRETARFTNTDPFRGLGAEDDPHAGFVGLQAHTGRVAFRNVRVRRD